ncbi:MAG: hypothetical protein M1835_005559 [Candelina submexicana]|nr:MAG: hypothetical protein M1835_005559 [Candelina submexicana]
MGKHKKRKYEKKPQKPSKKSPHGTRKESVPIVKKKQPPQHSEPTIPFEIEDRILLVGEGDFSFSQSLVSHHGCTSVLGTCFDSETELLKKYPQAQANIKYLLEEGQRVLYDVDAKKLDKREIKKAAKFNKVVFNFPHVGGLTKDMNRQVRHNQGQSSLPVTWRAHYANQLMTREELLVGFFRAALPLLAPAGTVIVTLFDGEPYTLWNVRDLARHVGLRVGRSFKFQSSAYPSYKHSRTLGNIESGGAWHGELRSARTYTFEVNDPNEVSQRSTPRIKKRRHEGSSDKAD